MQIFLPAFLEQIEKDRGQPTTGLVFLDGTSKYFIPTNGCLLSAVCEVMGVVRITIDTINQRLRAGEKKPAIGTQKPPHLKIHTSYLLPPTILKPSCAAQAVTQGSLHNDVSVRSGRCCEIALEDIG